jgi:hypothetical protein
VDRPDLDGTRLLGELADAVTDDEDHRVRRRQSCTADGADQPTGVTITQFVSGLGAKQAHQRGRGEVLARTRQAGHSGRDGRPRPGRRDVDVVDELTPNESVLESHHRPLAEEVVGVGCTAEFSQAPRLLWV